MRGKKSTTATKRKATTTKKKKAPSAITKKRAASTKKKSDVRRPRSAYIFFTMDERSKLKKGLSIGEQGAALGALWKKLSAAKRAPYLKKAEKDRERYYRELGGKKK